MSRPNKTYLFINLFYFVLVLAMVLQALTFTGEGGIVPLFVGVPTLALIVTALAGRWLGSRREGEQVSEEAAAQEPADVASWSRGLVIAAWVVAFFLLIFFVGFSISIPVYTLAFLRIEGGVTWTRSAVTAAILWAVIHVSFDVLMGQTLFPGVLFHALLPNL